MNTKKVPVKDNDYSDSSYARLYGSFNSFGLNETKLVWSRYAAFLVLEGFILKVLTDNAFSNLYLGISLSIIGIIISSIWHI